jgi:hypothetical protein
MQATKMGFNTKEDAIAFAEKQGKYVFAIFIVDRRVGILHSRTTRPTIQIQSIRNKFQLLYLTL